MMQVIIEIEGIYNHQIDRYCQPVEYGNWQDVILKNQIQLKVANIFNYFTTSRLIVNDRSHTSIRS
jgi:hypothetical protein